MIRKCDLIEWYKVRDALSMKRSTGLSMYNILGFLDSKTFEEGIEYLKKNYVMIREE
jgi:hypothetical protein